MIQVRSRIFSLSQSLLMAMTIIGTVTMIGCGDSAVSKQMAEQAKTLEEIQAKVDKVLVTLEPRDLAPLREKAKQAFNDGKDDVAFAYVAAIVASDPADQEMLQLLEAQTEKAVASAIDGDVEKFAEAESRLALYGELIKSAMASGRSVKDVERLLDAEQRLISLAEKISDKRSGAVNASIAQIEKQIAQLKQEAAQATSEVEVRELSLKVQRTLDTMFDTLSDAEQSDAEHVQSTDALIARLQEIDTELQTKLETANVNVMREVADRQTNDVIKRMTAILGEVETQRKSKMAKPTNVTWQSLGRKLVKAELIASGVHPMASSPIQERVSTAMTRLRRTSVAIRAAQQSSYNDWAIGQIKRAVKNYQDNKGTFNDDEAKFLKTIRSELGSINPQYLHPAVSTLFSEVHQKLISELSLAQQIQATEAVEATSKRSLEEF